MATSAPLQRVSKDVTAYGTKEIPVAWSEEIYTVGDALRLCRFITHGFNSPHLHPTSPWRPDGARVGPLEGALRGAASPREDMERG